MYKEKRHIDKTAQAKQLYLNNDEFHDYIERSARNGQYTVEELLGMAHVHEYIEWMLKRY